MSPNFLAPFAQKDTAPVNIIFTSTRLPTGVTGLPDAGDHTTNSRYESDVSIFGGVTGRFKGSIYPDNLNVSGRVRNGTYPIYLGFHKPGIPTQADLVVRINGFRAVLVINAGLAVPVSSLTPTKQLANGIHIHNGYNHWQARSPMSEGCLLIAPKDWTPFITLFLKAFTKLTDWSISGSRIGRKIGTVTVMAGMLDNAIQRPDVAYA